MTNTAARALLSEATDNVHSVGKSVGYILSNTDREKLVNAIYNIRHVIRMLEATDDFDGGDYEVWS